MELTFYTMLDFQIYFLISYFFKYVPTSCIKKVVLMGNLLTLTLPSLRRVLSTLTAPLFKHSTNLPGKRSYLNTTNRNIKAL